MAQNEGADQICACLTLNVVQQLKQVSGTNEHTTRLLRQYFPKGTDLSHYSQADLNQIALGLNQRPGKTVGFQTPAAILEAAVAAPPEPTKDFRRLKYCMLLPGRDMEKPYDDIQWPAP
jgi:hypothetical protein